MTSYATPICAGCKHLVGTLMDPRCAAFADGIPWPVLLSEVDHRKPTAGDNGIVFAAQTPKDAEYADRTFKDRV